MNLVRYLLVVSIISGFASTAEAFVLRTEAEASGDACCLPNGRAIGSATLTFSVELSSVEPEYFELQLAYNFQGQDDCDFFGNDLIIPRTQRVVIETASGASISTMTIGLQPDCPFNVRARSVARFANAVARDTSPCQRPCPDCVPWDEGW